MNVSVNDSIVVIGAGPIGCMHLQVARARGARKILLVEVQEQRLESAKSSGADIYINGAKEDAVQRVLDETDGRGAEGVIVACGVPAAQVQAMNMVAVRGIVNFFGGLPKDNSIVQLDTNIVHYNECWITGTHGSTPRHNDLAINLIAGGRINVKNLITHRFGLDDLMKGIEITEKGEGLRVIISP